MIKKHRLTGLKYLCKTTREGKAFDKYLGSGTRWRRHLKVHGSDISTEVIFETENEDDFRAFATLKSIEWNIVESDEWANLAYEMGQGGMLGASKLTRDKISIAHKGKPKSEVQRTKISLASKGKPKSSEHRAKLIARMANRKQTDIEKQKRAKTLYDRCTYLKGLPSNDELLKLVKASSISAVARKFSVTRGTIRNRINDSD